MIRAADPRARLAAYLAHQLGTQAASKMLTDAGLTPAARYLAECEHRRVIQAMRARRESVADIRANLMRRGMSRSSAYSLVRDELCRNRPNLGRMPETIRS